MFNFHHSQGVIILFVSFFAAVLSICLYVSKCNSQEKEQGEKISVHGAANNPLTISAHNLMAFSPFHINNVPMLREKGNKDQKEEIIGVFNYKGVLLRDILERAEMKYKRKWEPSVFIRVRGSKGKEVVFSFGEIFYSSIGRSIVIAYERDGAPIKFSEGCGELIVATDIRCGRRVVGVKEILVERVDIKMHAYEDKKKKIVRPPTKEFLVVDKKTGKHYPVTLNDLGNHPSVSIDTAVMIGDCEGFKGVFSFEGPSLRSVLEKFGIGSIEQSYDRYIVISSEDGFSAVFSFGEIFNSRLDNNIIIASKKDGQILGPKDGFAMSVVGEDSAGGRSVKRIQRMEIY